MPGREIEQVLTKSILKPLALVEDIIRFFVFVQMLKQVERETRWLKNALELPRIYQFLDHQSDVKTSDAVGSRIRRSA